MCACARVCVCACVRVCVCVCGWGRIDEGVWECGAGREEYMGGKRSVGEGVLGIRE